MTTDVRLDLHVHSRHSPDSSLTLDSIAQRLAYAGLRGFALTDHNSIAGHAELAALRHDFPGYLFLPGVEVSTSQGHVLAYGVDEAPPAHRPAAETVEWIRDHGGESVLAHPFRRRHGVGRHLAESLSATGVEARNGRNSEVSNLRAEYLAAQRSLTSTGGGDVHALPDLGRAYTYFPDEVRSVDDALEALRKRSTSPGGRSLAWPGRTRLALSTGAQFLRRGFRSI